MKWTEWGVAREADEATFKELLALRKLVQRTEERELISVLKRIATALETSNKEKGLDSP